VNSNAKRKFHIQESRVETESENAGDL